MKLFPVSSLNRKYRKLLGGKKAGFGGKGEKRVFLPLSLFTFFPLMKGKARLIPVFPGL
jgi:hypothetical protein